VQVINFVRLRDFSIDHGRAETSLQAWFQLVSSHNWETAESLTNTFPSAQIHAELVAFDLHGGSYFPITSIDFDRSTVWVRDVRVHNDFRTDEWRSLAASDESSGRSYNDLVEQFPLRPIRDDDHLRQAIARIDSLLIRSNRTLDEQDYLDVLSLLVAEYEHQQIAIPPVSGAEIVRTLISEHRLSQAEIIPLLGGKQKALALLQGSRPLDLRQATRVSRYFKLPIETFMDPDDLEIEVPKAPRRHPRSRP
jgi:HTH-type transcriptional regulator / antitoxin HigA